MKTNLMKRCAAALCSAMLLTGTIGHIPVNGETVNAVSNGSFDSDTKGWGVIQNNGAAASIASDNGQLKMDITALGTKSWSLQLWCGAVLYKNGVYRLSYDISSTVDRPVTVTVQKTSGDYQNYTSRTLNLTSQTQTVDYTFTMDYDTDMTAKFAINCGLFEEELGAHTITLDNVVLELVDDSNVEYTSYLPPEADIVTNQVGYKPDAEKVAVFRNVTDETTFSVVNADTGETVHTGDLYGMKENTLADETDWYGDFSAVTESGSYYITCGNLEDSYPFEVSETIYDTLLDDTVRMFYLARCGCEVEDDIFGHASCHASEAVLYGTEETIDVSGGWHDAGDYGRYVVPGAKAVADLMIAYAVNPGLFSDNAGIPESGNGVPDILDETRYELEWMLKMQAESGGVYHKVTTQEFAKLMMPDEDTAQLIVLPPSTTATADFCAVMAMAYEAYAEYDKGFSEVCLSAAEKAWSYLEANPDLYIPVPEDIGTGDYDDTDDMEERYWAAAQMYHATGDASYYDYIETECTEVLKIGRGVVRTGEYANFAILDTDGVDIWSEPYIDAKYAMLYMADQYVEKAEAGGYNIGVDDFYWGSNMSVADAGVTLYLAYQYSGDKKYLDAAQYHLHYLLGRNPNSISFVTGYGTVSPENPHHNPSETSGQVMTGMLVGGVNSRANDIYAQTYLAGVPEAKRYADIYECYSLNEITIYWNSPLVSLLALTEEKTAAVRGDVNADGEFTVADLVMLQKWLIRAGDITDRQAGDLCEDGKLDVFDLIVIRNELISEAQKNYVDVSNVEELFLAMRGAQPGDVIRVASGTYDYTTYQGAQKIDTSAEGTEDAPITLTAADPENPPIITGTSAENGYVIQITGDNWILENLKITTSQKGIVLDNSNHSIIRNCEVYNTGSEAIAIRDGSSYCTVKDSYIHDTGTVTPGYGEGVYIGSAKSVTGFDYKCDYNIVDGCTFKNVAAEHVDVKEYTTGTEIMNCTFYGDGMTGANYAGSFVDIAGNDVNVHDNIGYRNGNTNIVAAFELHEQVEDWGYHCIFTDNTLYMDQPYGAVDTSRRMYVVDGWYSDFSVRNNQVDYGNGLVAADSWEYYNSDYVTYLAGE